VGAVTSIISGYLGMMIATYANARTALEARKGVAPAFMAGEQPCHRPKGGEYGGVQNSARGACA
jgi:hypothetical protein